MSDQDRIDKALASVVAAPATLQLLRELHSQALAEPAYVSTDSQPASAALNRFVALEPEKCAIVYLLLRASGATNIVEAGTSFGVSTIYLALAARQNALLKAVKGKVIATENESTKAIRARENWKRSDTSDDIIGCIDLREGDLRETLKTDLPEPIDFLLLDIWSSLALPTLQVVQPRLKKGATIVVDNIVSSAAGYEDLVHYLSDTNNGFRTTTAPYDGGLLIAVYTGGVYLLEIEEASQDIKTADATLASLREQAVATAQNEPRPSVTKTIVNALVTIVALFLALFGFGIGDAPTEEDTRTAEAVKKLSLERKKAEKRVKRAEAHMRALDRLVEAQELDIGDNGTGSWEMVQRWNDAPSD
ncbi:hypothetical protein FPANT_3224 [Fusarium pseudoanthophilum]|uniref:O-methyltransferase n=1 Tax=Fusarium pseudoanthophilum TaxID=48495 RepID=A0A8H5PMS6_9HYPO|nr:hypothetical protein FPANT_3224 [Fusarium pseudoanthophilum]